MEYLLTVEEVERLKGKIAQLDQEAITINSKISRLIRSDDDFLNSCNYDILKKRASIDIPKEKRELRDKLNMVKIVCKDDYPFEEGKVSIYSRVTLDYDGEVETYDILPIYDDDIIPDVMSCNSPIAKLILGKKKNNVVVLRGINVKIVNVEKN